MNKSSKTSLKYEELTPLTHLHYQSGTPSLCDPIPLIRTVDSVLPSLSTLSPLSVRHQQICQHSGSKKAQATSLCVWTRGYSQKLHIQGTNKCQMRERTKWLIACFSTRAPFGTKNLIIKPLTQKQSELMASYDYELKPSANYILGLQAPCHYTWLTDLRSRGCSFIS